MHAMCCGLVFNEHGLIFVFKLPRLHCGFLSARHRRLKLCELPSQHIRRNHGHCIWLYKLRCRYFPRKHGGHELFKLQRRPVLDFWGKCLCKLRRWDVSSQHRKRKLFELRRRQGFGINRRGISNSVCVLPRWDL